MAGTNRRLVSDASADGATANPRIILCRPQLAENVGMVARAMLNCGLTELYLVAPREDWLSEKAIAAASGADHVLRQAIAVDSTEASVADLQTVYATTARRRDMVKRILTPRQASRRLRQELAGGYSAGILFGPERTGLENDDLVLADAIVEVPLNPSYCSLNLAQAVLLMGYEWYQEGLASPEPDTETDQQEEDEGEIEEPAPRGDLIGLMDHLERELIACGFLRLEDKRPTMVRNLKNIFTRPGLTAQEIRTLHGVITELRWGGRPDRPGRQPKRDQETG